MLPLCFYNLRVLVGLSLAFLAGCQERRVVTQKRYVQHRPKGLDVTAPPPRESRGGLTRAPQRVTSRPYVIKGVRYCPRSYYEYTATGLASWYGAGDGCNGKKTASGDIFYDGLCTAAHRTLPLPCVALITNLENGRTIKVKVNDRGPFKHRRLCDVSRRVAWLLGFHRKGVTRVHMRVLVRESLALPENKHRFSSPLRYLTRTRSVKRSR